MKINAKTEKQFVKVAAKTLGVAKGAIKILIKDKVVDYELIDGHYCVDIEEVRKALKGKREVPKSKVDNTSSLETELKKILNLTAGDLTMLNQRSGSNNPIVSGAIADCKEIIRYGAMVPSNCTNIISYIQSSPYVNMPIPFGQDKIGWTIYEHKQIMKHFNKTMKYSSIGGMGHIVEYK